MVYARRTTCSRRFELIAPNRDGRRVCVSRIREWRRTVAQALFPKIKRISRWCGFTPADS